MNILWFTWKDRRHPQAGGAETVNDELAKRLVRDGHRVTFVVAGFDGGGQEEMIDGYTVIRLGGKYTVYWKAFRYYKKHLQGWADLVIDEMNTLPFFCKLYIKEKLLLFSHQLCREIWFYQMPWAIAWIGYIAEPIYLWLLNDMQTITISKSTKRDLMRYGFRADAIEIISEGIEIDPLTSLDNVEKYVEPTLLSLGAIREMKRTDHQIKAFELAKKAIPRLKLKIAGTGSGKYFNKVQKMIQSSVYAKDIEYLGRISKEQKIKLLQACHCILVTSVKEGWGLIVTEANSQGTPAIGYNADGLRDSIRNGATGFLTVSNTPESMAIAVEALFHDPKRYEELRLNAWKWSQEITFENSYRKFLNTLQDL